MRPQLFTQRPLSRARKLLIGALFSGEYALESAALFNPSIVPHPDQDGLPAGGLRFIMSLRATGEGHISSIEFRTGVIAPTAAIQLDPVSRFVTVPEIVPNPSYTKTPFIVKLHEMGFDNDCAAAVMEPLAESFTRSELDQSVQQRPARGPCRSPRPPPHAGMHPVAGRFQLRNAAFRPSIASASASSFRSPPTRATASRTPVSSVSSRTMARSCTTPPTPPTTATRFFPSSSRPQDFLHFRMLTLNGGAVQNKGMALFPRRIDGRYAMLSRQDDENLFDHVLGQSPLLERSPGAPAALPKPGSP